jgi:hypothetical protein
VAATPLSQDRTRTFVETGKTVAGRFLDVWESRRNYAASLYLNGLPLTDKRPELSYTDGKTYPTQWFERARFEEHAEHHAPYDVQLGLLGVYAAEGRQDPAFQGVARSACPTGADYFPETRHCLSGTLRTYFYQYGGVVQFGFPLSEPFSEAARDVPGALFTVQYFERQRMELHPEQAGTPYAVLLGRLGAEQVGQVAEPLRTYPAEAGTPVDPIRVG